MDVEIRHIKNENSLIIKQRPVLKFFVFRVPRLEQMWFQLKGYKDLHRIYWKKKNKSKRDAQRLPLPRSKLKKKLAKYHRYQNLKCEYHKTHWCIRESQLTKLLVRMFVFSNEKLNFKKWEFWQFFVFDFFIDYVKISWENSKEHWLDVVTNKVLKLVVFLDKFKQVFI